MLIVARHLTYLSLLFAACFFLMSPALAEVACEDMPCCVETLETVNVSQDCQMTESSSNALLSCGDSVSDCSCVLQSEAPLAKNPKTIMTLVRYEFTSREIEILELPLALLDLTEDKSDWLLTNQTPRDDFFLALSTFPNPPPAAA